MMDIVINDPRASDWVKEKIPKVHSWMGEHKSLAALEEGEIIGAVVYDAFTPFDCCIHVRLDKAGCKVPGVLRQVFGYPFEQLGLTRITGLVSKSNEKGIALCTWLGFTFEGVKEKALGDEDEVIFGMTRESCKWV